MSDEFKASGRSSAAALDADVTKIAAEMPGDRVYPAQHVSVKLVQSNLVRLVSWSGRESRADERADDDRLELAGVGQVKGGRGAFRS